MRERLINGMALLMLVILAVTMLPAGTALAYTEHISTTISTDTTWGPGTHYVSGNNIVNSGVTLTIDPGAVVKFKNGITLLSYGTVDAHGTVSDPIIFTSVNDDTCGETIPSSNGSPVPGNWTGIYLNGGDAYQYDGIGYFDHCILRYGGNASSTGKANLYFYRSDDGHFTNCVSEYSGMYGVSIFEASPPVTDSNMSDNLSHGLYVSHADSAPVVTDNTFSGNVGYGAYMNNIDLTAYSGNSGSGNGFNGFGVVGMVTENSTWSQGSPDFPFILVNRIWINPGKTLTLVPGTVLKGVVEGRFEVRGTLEAMGTREAPIVFTSIKDDTFAGDTNGDGSATSPAPGDWRGIWCNGDSVAQGIGHFTHCYIGYGGHPAGDAGANLFFYKSDSGNLTDSVCEYSATHGIRNDGSAPSVIRSTIAHNNGDGVHLEGYSCTLLGSSACQWNIIYNSGSYNFYNNGTYPKAEYVWWGTADAGAIEDGIYHYPDDPGKGTVDYTPYLTGTPARYTLDVSSTEGGSVTAPGEGQFGYDCETVVPIVAEASPCYRFAGWTGSGTPAIANPGLPSTTITVDGDYEITASFEYECVTVDIYLSLQGEGRPEPAGWEIPISIGFYPPGSPDSWLLEPGSAIYHFSGTTSHVIVYGGTRAYFQCPEPVAAGTYDITADSETTLLNVKRGVHIE